MKQKTLDTQIIWGALTTAIFLSGFYVYLYVLVGEKYDEAKSVYQSVVLERAQKNEETQTADLLRSTAPLRDKLSLFFLDKDNAVVFLEKLEALGKDIGTKIVIASARESEGWLMVSFTSTGSFEKMFQVLKLVETMPFYTKLENVSLSKIEGDEKIPSRFRLEATVRVASFKKENQ